MRAVPVSRIGFRRFSRTRMAQTSTSSSPQVVDPCHANRTTTNPFVLKSKYADFKQVEATRPLFDSSAPISISQTPNTSWSYGDGAGDKASLTKDHVEIDPFEDGRPMISNYTILISGIPRPISLISTISKDGVANLAPMSYFQVVDHDPPTFVVGFSARASRPKDTLVNLRETGECVINVVSEHMVEAVNATSIDVPYGISEWALSGFHAAASSTVKASRVKEAIFSIEEKVMEVKELDYHGHAKAGKPTGSLAIIEATRFWIRDDAVNNERDQIDLGVMKSLTQLGGISYGKVRETFELPRPSFAAEVEKEGPALERLLDVKTGEHEEIEINK